MGWTTGGGGRIKLLENIDRATKKKQLFVPHWVVPQQDSLAVFNGHPSFWTSVRKNDADVVAIMVADRAALRAIIVRDLKLLPSSFPISETRAFGHRFLRGNLIPMSVFAEGRSPKKNNGIFRQSIEDYVVVLVLPCTRLNSAFPKNQASRTAQTSSTSFVFPQHEFLRSIFFGIFTGSKSHPPPNRSNPPFTTSNDRRTSVFTHVSQRKIKGTNIQRRLQRMG